MPQTSQTKSQTNGTPSSNGDYQAIDPQKDPLSFVYQNRDALSRMDPEKAVKFADMMFRRYALPKYQKMNQQRPLDEEEVERLRLQFAARLFDIPFDQETKLKDVKPEYGVLEKGAHLASAAGAGVIGGLRTIEELREFIQKHLGPVGKALQYDPINILSKKVLGSEGPASKVEGKAYSEAKGVVPQGADVAAGIGHQIPASIAAGGVGSVLPGAAKTAPLAARMLAGGGRGVIEGATFEASRPGGSPSAGAQWGGVLGAAFPTLGRLFGLGRRISSAAPEAAKAVEAGTSVTAKAASGEVKSLGDVAEKAAKDKFGKSFKDLTSAEKAQMPSFMKEEVAKQQAQRAATKKAEQAAAKAGREADAVAKRAEKAKAASAKAATQAAKRSETGTSTPVTKQAVAAQAASENPDLAKTMASFKPGEGTAAAAPGQSIKSNIDQEVESAKHELEKAKNILKSEKASPEEKKIAMDNYKFWKEKLTAKVPEGQAGLKIRAKGGQPASPAQQAADRERIAAKRELAKGEQLGEALGKQAQELAGRHVSAAQIGIQHIPELESAIKEIPNGEIVLRGLQKLRKAGRITDEIYAEEIKNWMLTQFESEGPKAAD